MAKFLDDLYVTGNNANVLVINSDAVADILLVSNAGSVAVGSNNFVGNVYTNPKFVINTGSGIPGLMHLNSFGVELVTFTNVGDSLFGNASNHDLTFITNNLERIKVTADGAVGINHLTPPAQLTVVGVGNTSATHALRIGNSSSDVLLNIRDDKRIQLNLGAFYPTASEEISVIERDTASITGANLRLRKLKFYDDGNPTGINTPYLYTPSGGTFGINASNISIESPSINSSQQDIEWSLGAKYIWFTQSTTKYFKINIDDSGSGIPTFQFKTSTSGFAGPNRIGFNFEHIVGGNTITGTDEVAHNIIMSDNGSNTGSLIGLSIDVTQGSNTARTLYALKLVDGSEGINKILVSDASGRSTWNSKGSLGIISGSGTLNYVAKFTPDGATLDVSSIFDNGTNVGINNITPTAKLHIQGIDSTSSNYSFKVENSVATNLFSIRNDGQFFYDDSFIANPDNFNVGNILIGPNYVNPGKSRIISIGSYNTNSDRFSVCVGSGSSAGYKSSTIGTGNIANESCAIIGNNSKALGISSFVVGEYSISTGNRSFIIGSGYYLLGANYLTNAIDDSIIFGVGSITPSMIVMGADAVSNAGNVGIGTLTPTFRLDVNGNANISDGLTVDTVVSSPTANALHTLNGHVVIDDLSGPGTRTVNVDASGKLIAGAAPVVGAPVKYSTTFTPGTVNVANTITHSLGTTDISVTLWDVTTGEIILAKVSNRTSTQVDVTFTTNPAGNVRAVIIG